MRNIFLIAHNTYREIMRDRVLYALVVFAILLIGLSLALGQLSFAEQGRIAMNFGMVGMQLSAVILSIFSGSTLVAKEIEKQTILTLLSKPLSRPQFLVGKFLGLFGVIFVLVLGLSLVLILVSYIVDASLGMPFWVGIWGIFLEALTMLAVTLLFGVIIRPFLTIACALGIFLIGHWIENLLYFSRKGENESFRIMGEIVSRAIPNLERFNWRSLVTYQDAPDWNIVGSSSLFALAWVVALISLAVVVFRRRDFV